MGNQVGFPVVGKDSVTIYAFIFFLVIWCLLAELVCPRLVFFLLQCQSLETTAAASLLQLLFIKAFVIY